MSTIGVEVGDFSIDVLTRDLGRDRLVVIENQLEATDHTRLGQVITYAPGVETGGVVWIYSDIDGPDEDWNLGSFRAPQTEVGPRCRAPSQDRATAIRSIPSRVA